MHLCIARTFELIWRVKDKPRSHFLSFIHYQKQMPVACLFSTIRVLLPFTDWFETTAGQNGIVRNFNPFISELIPTTQTLTFLVLVSSQKIVS